MTIGERLQTYRKQKNLSQEDLAKKLLVTRQTVSLWETDQTLPTVENLIRLKDIFGVSIDDILIEPKPQNIQTPKAIETYSFQYTSKSIQTVNKLRYTKSFAKPVFVLILLICFMAFMISTEAPDILIGIFFGAFFLYVFSLIKAQISLHQQKKEVEQRLLPNSYVYEVYNTFIKVSILKDNRLLSEKNIYPENISKFWNTDNLFIFECDGQAYCLQKNTLPDAARFFSFFQKARSADTPTNTALRLQQAATLFFIVSLLIFPLFGVWLSANNENESFFLSESWKLYLLLPIPLTSIVLGILLKRKGIRSTKNIVIGVLASFILIGYGSFSFIFAHSFDTNYEIVNNVEHKTNINLPNSGKISTQYGFDAQNGSPSVFEYFCQISFTDEEVAEFETALPTDARWQTEMPTVLTSLLSSWQPSFAEDYYLLYNLDTEEYNTYPSQSGYYRFVYITYNIEKNYMSIIEYEKEIVLSP